MLFIEHPTAIVNCITAINVLFFYINVCLSVKRDNLSSSVTSISHIINYLCIFSIITGVLSPVYTLVALSPDIFVVAITGYTDKSKESFQSKIKSMDIFVEKNVKFKDHDGSPGKKLHLGHMRSPGRKT
jgi:hypothetical protein